MRFSRAVDYALKALAYLAALPQGAVATRSALAKATHLAEPFLAKVMRKLVTARLVTAHPGVHGGFALSRTPQEITLLQVVEAIDGPWSLEACLLHTDRCGEREFCGVHDALTHVKAEMLRVLRTTSISSISRQAVQLRSASG